MSFIYVAYLQAIVRIEDIRHVCLMWRTRMQYGTTSRTQGPFPLNGVPACNSAQHRIHRAVFLYAAYLHAIVHDIAPQMHCLERVCECELWLGALDSRGR